MEVFGGSSRRSGYVSRSQLQKLKKGGQIAEQIQQESKLHHEEVELPKAEKMLIENIDSAYTENTSRKDITIEIVNTNISFWKKVQNFIQRLFYPSSKS